MSNLKRVLMMAGGTGGHIFPGLAVVNALRKNGVDVHWLGTQKGLEAKIVPEANIPLHFISISGVRGKGIKDIVFAPFRLTLAIYQAFRIIRQLKPDVVIGMGGFVSGPGGIASWLLRRPLIIHEQNAKPGTTNKWLAKVAKKVLEGFPNTFKKRDNVVTIGNPIRHEIAALPEPMTRLTQHRDITLLVLGGSLGAQAINQLIPQALAALPLEKRPQVYHQAGEKHYADTVTAYQKAGVTAKIAPFIKDMDHAYSTADFVLCRAGALTVAELCAVGVGAILVPFPHAIDDHQTANANVMVTKGAALLAPQATLTVDKLAALVNELVESPTRRQAMAEAAYLLRQVDATEKVLTICEEICT